MSSRTVAARSSPSAFISTTVSARLDSIEYTAGWALDSICECSWWRRWSSSIRGPAGHDRQADGLAVGGTAVIFVKGVARVSLIFVHYKCCAGRSVGAVVKQADGNGGTYAFEKFLLSCLAHSYSLSLRRGAGAFLRADLPQSARSERCRFGASCRFCLPVSSAVKKWGHRETYGGAPRGA